jgi:hypothetical protein
MARADEGPPSAYLGELAGVDEAVLVLIKDVEHASQLLLGAIRLLVANAPLEELLQLHRTVAIDILHHRHQGNEK